jgi:lincosamide nucleotidyltransferase A/C/D/E
MGPARQRPSPQARGRPPLFYLITGSLNVLVWRLPLPRRALSRLSATVYRNPPMPGERVLRIVDALDAAGAHCWIGGGWGIDALAGTQTRTHRDLDLIIDQQQMQRVLDALADLGYWEWYRSDSDVPLRTCIVLHDHDFAGWAIDLHAVPIAQTPGEFAVGEVQGRTVPCISLALQITTHAPLRGRREYRGDIAQLDKLAEGSAALIVPVPAAEALLQDSAREGGMPAHLALRPEFLSDGEIGEETEAELASLLEAVPSFDFALSEIGRYPGIVYVSAEPATPWLALVQALARRWPDERLPPEAGREAVPHLPVAHGTQLPSGLAEQLPVSARAEEVWLMKRAGGRWTRRRAFALGRAPASRAG